MLFCNLLPDSIGHAKKFRRASLQTLLLYNRRVKEEKETLGTSSFDGVSEVKSRMQPSKQDDTILV